MFFSCFALKNIKPLENWNVSKGTNFSKMFTNCSSLKDIKPTKKWKISQSLLNDIK